MKTKLMFIVGLLFSGGCTSQETACRTMTNFGFRNCTVVDTAYFWHPECGQDDNIAFRVQATNTSSQRISMTVCCGTFKGCTIRSR